MSSSKQEKIDSLYGGGFRFIRKIDVHREILGNHSGKFSFEIYLTNDCGAEAKIYARDCADISIGKIDNMLAALVEVIDLRKDQIEGVRYKIFDSENDLFSVLCADFEVKILAARPL